MKKNKINDLYTKDAYNEPDRMHVFHNFAGGDTPGSLLMTQNRAFAPPKSSLRADQCITSLYSLCVKKFIATD